MCFVSEWNVIGRDRGLTPGGSLKWFAAQFCNSPPTGHRNIATTQRYTHLRPVHEIPAHERLADAVPIADLVTATRKRASGKPAGKNAGTETGHSQNAHVESDSASVGKHA